MQGYNNDRGQQQQQQQDVPPLIWEQSAVGVIARLSSSQADRLTSWVFALLGN
jgi:hypothetical protein